MLSYLKEKNGRCQNFKKTICIRLKFLILSLRKPLYENYKTGSEKMNKIKILVAEDDQINRKLFSYILKDISSELLMAADGMEAIEIFKNNADIDLILMDLKMPGMDGYEATAQIRQINTDVKIIALSAFSIDTEQRKAKENGFNDYVSKPVSKVLLMEKISNYFEM